MPAIYSTHCCAGVPPGPSQQEMMPPEKARLCLGEKQKVPALQSSQKEVCL